MNKYLAMAAMAAVGIGAAAQEPVAPYLDASLPIETRVEDALGRLTLAEKVGLLHAQSKFSSRGVRRLGIPELWTTDGPHGIRAEVKWDEWDQADWTNDSCVAFPALTALAATWDPALALKYGRAIGQEARYREKDVLLGPGVNIYRTPLNGRNFEYMGEDPFLASVMVVPYVKGVQENGVAACVKHYALNNQEMNRHTTNVTVDPRALHEIYLPAFKAAVDSGAWSIMGAYNLKDNEHLCHNREMLVDILKNRWGFDGAVISDWGGVHDTDQAITNGMDLEFGSWTNGLSEGKSNAYDSYYLADPYLERLKDGRADTTLLNDKVRRVLRLIFRTAMNNSKPVGSMCSPEHYAVAREIGADGIVLLKNKGGLLPLTEKTRKILVVGENAVKMMTVGGGSSSLKVQREVLPLDGLRANAPAGTEIKWVRGYVGDPTGEYNGVVTGQNLADSRTAAELTAEAVEAAADADVVIFVGGLNKKEGQDAEGDDRKAYDLPYGQSELVAALVKANPNLVFVNVSGNGVAMPWINDVPAVVQAWFLGSEAGNSLADVLYGRVNPSGKLPFTMPVSYADTPMAFYGEKAYPGIKRQGEDILDESYDEGIYVGYRWYDDRKIKPLFPFGHGLSYTDFGYGRLTADRKSLADGETITFTLPVTNKGQVAGAETVQLYITDKDSRLPRPVKELKGFKKVFLQPGETQTVTFTIGSDALSYFDPEADRFVAEPGRFRASAGASSADLRSSVDFDLK